MSIKNKMSWYKKMIHLIIRVGNFGIKHKILDQQDITALQRVSLKFQAEIDSATNAQSTAKKSQEEWKDTM